MVRHTNGLSQQLRMCVWFSRTDTLKITRTPRWTGCPLIPQITPTIHSWTESSSCALGSSDWRNMPNTTEANPIASLHKLREEWWLSFSRQNGTSTGDLINGLGASNISLHVSIKRYPELVEISVNKAIATSNSQLYKSLDLSSIGRSTWSHNKVDMNSFAAGLVICKQMCCQFLSIGPPEQNTA